MMKILIGALLSAVSSIAVAQTTIRVDQLPPAHSPLQPGDLIMVDQVTPGGTGYTLRKSVFSDFLNGTITSSQLGYGAAAANLGFVPLNPSNSLLDLTNKPASLANLLGSSVIPISNGGTGSSNLSSMWNNFGVKIVNVLTYGADPTGVTDSTAAIQTAINSGTNSGNNSINLPGTCVYVPAGNYKISSAINLPATNSCFYGDGRTLSVLNATTNFSGSGVLVAPPYLTNGAVGAIVRDIGVWFTEPDVADRASLINYPPGIYMQSANVHIEHVRVSGGTSCIDARGNTGGSTFDDIECGAMTTGLQLGNGPTYPGAPNHGTITGGSYDSGTSKATITGTWNLSSIVKKAITVQNASPSCLNGTWYVTAYDIGSITYVVPGCAAWTSGGTISAMGAADSVHITNWHTYPFGWQAPFTNSLRYLYCDGNTVAMDIGRVDGLNVSGIQSYCANINYNVGASNAQDANYWANVSLDSSQWKQAGGQVYVTNFNEATGGNGPYLNGTNVRGSDGWFPGIQMGGANSDPNSHVYVNNANVSGYRNTLGGVNVSGGYVSIETGNLGCGNGAVPCALVSSGGSLVVKNMDFSPNSVGGWSTNTTAFLTQTGGNMTVSGNRFLNSNAVIGVSFNQDTPGNWFSPSANFMNDSSYNFLHSFGLVGYYGDKIETGSGRFSIYSPAGTASVVGFVVDGVNYWQAGNATNSGNYFCIWDTVAGSTCPFKIYTGGNITLGSSTSNTVTVVGGLAVGGTVTASTIGTRATYSSSLSDRATDTGVTFNLKEDFGAKCDGGTDDTDAIEAWLNKAAKNVHLVAPAGVCLFSSPLTTPNIGSYSITGAGPDTTRFIYTGASSTVDLLTINTTNGGFGGILLADFGVMSRTTMTDGFAIKANGLFDTTFRSVWADQVNVNETGKGNLCGGIWINGAGGVHIYDGSAYSVQNCGDALRVNKALGGGAEVIVFGGDWGGKNTGGVVTGFANGFHMAGGFGGFRCVSSNVHNNGIGLLIDHSIVSERNREFDQVAGCAFDGNKTAGVELDDSLVTSPGSVVNLSGWVASTMAGPGILVKNWAGTINLNGDMLYNNCGDGIDVEDSNASVLISPSLQIFNNGTTLGGNAACAAWKATSSATIAAAGTGYGASATGTMTWAGTGINACTTPPVLNATTDGSGAIISTSVASAGICALAPSSGATTWTPGGGLSAGSGAKFTVASNAWHGWGLYAGVLTTGMTGTTTPIGNAAGAFNSLTNFSTTTLSSAPQQNAYLNLNQVGGSNSAVLQLEGDGVPQWSLAYTNVGDKPFKLSDWSTGSSVQWLSVFQGGNATIGETTSNILTLKGAAQLGAYTYTELTSAITCNSTNAGSLTYVTNSNVTTGNIAGGGTNKVLALCNGTNWTAH